MGRGMAPFQGGQCSPRFERLSPAMFTTVCKRDYIAVMLIEKHRRPFPRSAYPSMVRLPDVPTNPRSSAP